MAHRCRTCGLVHYNPEHAVHFPWPDRLSRIDAVIPELLEAAREFEACCVPGEPVGTPVEFVEWLSIETRRAALVTGSRGGLTARIK